ncbi:hypothetical protein [Nostoc sp. FACHB-888]|uniref:hypothetical protein n=1 Tax=Nostoc sp. FACHB-888 TaxID=2692842 RepID=UPI00199BE6B2|nr:hypothetical protein [Nostoc sp. FACHB-888]MBD2245326.1 hypothetical protein [Nostoc sp. FACHB-888]
MIKSVNSSLKLRSFSLLVAGLALGIPHAQSSMCDRVTVSLGVVSIVPNSEVSPQDLIKAKQQGRDQVHAVCVVTPS